ncbi:MAG: hypothetical protein JXA77_18300 [Bacteroidales bacterium]|nr:hypothetical protein [Bacteroidales bacterium]MBN2818137.1 hypothetical protein [Bacteroidales bacterium]
MQQSDLHKNLQNPFPGLRPFDPEESHLFFGREGQSETIVNYLSRYKFSVITGASGSGKSSLIYCGVIPLLCGGYMPEAGTNWKTIAIRPGNTPIWNLAKGIAKLNAEKQKDDSDDSVINYFYAVLKRHSLGLSEAVDQILHTNDENLLIVVDQFEELFRYKESRKTLKSHGDDPEKFVNLLVETTKKLNSRVYIVITMRSDFIGECSVFHGLTQLINKSSYLVPLMTRTDYEHVITGPLRIANVEIEPNLLQTLLNNLDKDNDQLPVLQHTLMRTWKFWLKNNTPDNPLSMRDYMSAGKLENALSLHANEAYNELDDEERQLCKVFFKSITDKGKEGKGIRRPITIKEISELSLKQPTEIIKVINVFRKPGRSFLTPSAGIELNEDSVIDISHESLMRVWDKLKDWVDEEAASSEMYLRLVHLSGLYQIGRTGLMRPPDLHLASTWKKNQSPNRAWAKRYNIAFDKAMVYLNTSEKRFQQEEEIKVRIQKRELRRTRRLAVIMGFFAIAFFALMFWTYNLSLEATEQKELAEGYAKILESEKDTAVRGYHVKEYERLLALHQRDSLEKASTMKILQQEEETEQAYLLIDEVTQRTAELEKNAEQFEQEKQQAEELAIRAQQGLSKLEVEKMMEKKKRMITLSQSVALKALQVPDKQLSGLLAYQAYLINRENGGQINHPEIYRGLYYALRELKGMEYNTLKGQKGSVTCLLFDPARNLLYSSDNEGYVERWSFRNNTPTPVSIVANEDANTCIALTIDGRWIAVGLEVRTIQLINALQPEQRPRIFDAHDGSVLDICFIPGRNAMVSRGTDNKVKYWDLLVDESTVILQEQAGVNDICTSLNGKTVLIATNNGQLIEWNVRTKQSKIIFTHKSPLTAVTYDFESEKIAVSDQYGNLMILSAGGNLQKSINAHSSRILAVSFSPDNRLIASSGMDGVVRIWNATDWNDLPIEIREQESWVNSLSFSPDGNMLITSSNNENLIYRWPVKAENMADEMCNFIVRQLSQQEWNTYIGNDIEYRTVCN